MNSLLSLSPAAMAACVLNVLFPLTTLCLIAILAIRYAFRHNPSLRYFVCLAGLLFALSCPSIIGIQHRLGFSLLNLTLPQSCFRSPVPAVSVASTPILGAATQNAAVHPSILTAQWMSRGLWAVLSLWMGGVVWGIVRLVYGCNRALRLTQDVRPWIPQVPIEPLETLETKGRSDQASDRALPPVCTSARIVSPIAIGLFRPMVLLPEGLSETLTSRQLRHVLLHECAHVALHHTFGGVVARMAGIVFWPHPLIHVLCRELARAREEVCDNVASQEDGAACYARTLLAIAQGMDSAPDIASALALLGLETSLEERITGLLDPRRNRMVRVKRWNLWAVTGTAVCVLASTAVVRVVAAETQAKQESKQESNGASDPAVEAARRKVAEKGMVTDEKEIIAAKRALEAALHRNVAPGQRVKPDTDNISPAERIAAKRKLEAELIAARQKLNAAAKTHGTGSVGQRRHPDTILMPGADSDPSGRTHFGIGKYF